MKPSSAPPLPTTRFAAGIIRAKPIPANSRPSENFKGLDGLAFRLPIASQIAANTGANRIMKSELMDWNQIAGTSKPSNVAIVKSAAKQIERRWRLLERGPKNRSEEKQNRDHQNSLLLSTIQPPKMKT